jgi:hypothetical protein
MQKICHRCGVDCSTITRYQDPSGRYYCHPCFQKLPIGNAPSAAAEPAQRSAPAVSIQHGAAGYRGPRNRTASASWTDHTMLLLGATLGPFALFAAISRIAPAVGYGLYMITLLALVLALAIAVLVSAFRVSTVQGLLTLLVPFYSLYYVFGVSKSRTLMTLLPATVAAWMGAFIMIAILPSQTGSMEGPSSQLVLTDDASERTVGGYSVTVFPAGNSSSFGRIAGGHRLHTMSGGKRISVESNRPINLEQWQVGSWHIMVVNDELIVNFNNYGVLKQGDKVQVREGAVLINGKPARQKQGSVRVTVQS